MKFLIVLSLAAVVRSSPIYPQDTPEVAAAKAEHIAEVQRAYAAAGVAFIPPAGFGSSGVPVITPDGFVAETPEVAAARAAHLAEKARITAARPAYTPQYSPPPPAYAPSTPAYAPPPPAYAPVPPTYAPAPPSYSYSPTPYYYNYPASYIRSAGPYATPVVTPSGYLAETPEVAAARAAHLAEVARVLGQAPQQ